MNFGIKLVTILTISLFASASWAQDLRLELRVGSQILPHESVDFVSAENELPTQTLRVSSELLPNTRLVVEYGSEAPGIEYRHNEVEVQYLRQRFMIGADWGPTFFGFLRPLAGMTLGYALGSLDFDTSEIRYDDYSHDLIADAYLGTEAKVDFAKRWYFVGGLRFGARLQTAAQFDELTTNRPEDDPWDREDPTLGTLYPNGWYFDLGVGIGLNF